jgi:hypothetical protein
MINRLIQYQKRTAGVLLLTMLLQWLVPVGALALTSGPAQPEMKGFEPVSNTDLVDLFTGDFSYNIPLLDIEGYPVNLNYKAGSGPDEEASWVGFGWSLSPGAVTRQLRGLPDEFDGSDKITKETQFKDHITKGITTTISVDLLGIPGKAKGGVSISPSLSVGVEYDNYRGIGTKIGMNAGISIGKLNTDKQTNNVESGMSPGGSSGLKGQVNLNLSSSSLDGASAGVNFSILKNFTGLSEHQLTGSVGFPYSSRAGLRSMTLGLSYKPTLRYADAAGTMRAASTEHSGSSTISFAGEAPPPFIDVPTKTSAYSASITGGAQASVVYIGGGVSGYYNRNFIEPQNRVQKLNAYGTMHLEKAVKDDRALMDFSREKDIPFSPEVRYLPVPVPSNDLFNVTSQIGGGQYTVARDGHGVFFDPALQSGGSSAQFGLEVGGGYVFDLGADLYFQKTAGSSGKWKADNGFAAKGDYPQNKVNNTLLPHAYFTKVGQPVRQDPAYQSKIAVDAAVAVALNKNTSSVNALPAWRAGSNQLPVTATLKKQTKEKQLSPFNYLTAAEASLHGLSQQILSYPENEIVIEGCASTGNVQSIARVGDYRKKHHLSEIVNTTSDGRRAIYGIPVYNTHQEEVSFSVQSDDSKRAGGSIPYDPDSDAKAGSNNKGRENYVSRQITPAYATGHLLTAVLSGDYQDRTGNGVTDDDPGTAIRFNYRKLPALYKWRTPYGAGESGYNEGLISDKLDDKGSYSYGTKEIWYTHSIESKTMVAQFITEDRQDAFGVAGPEGGKEPAVALKRLKEIRLYSKSDIRANSGDITKCIPVKTVHFEYTYSLIKGLPSAADNPTGKLTLRKIYFTYGNNLKGKLSPYSFEYYNDSSSVAYHLKMYDRWGTYKDAAYNPGGMNNAEYGYTLQDSAAMQTFVSNWQLRRIHLPSGASLEVTYESDDYAYVQNKKAMQMCAVEGVGAVGSNTGLIGAEKIYITLPRPVSGQKELEYYYGTETRYLYFKFFTDLDHKGHYEFVPGYAKIKAFSYVDNNTASVQLEPQDAEGVGSVNPIAYTGWQFIRANLPKYAYPGYENLEADGGDLKKAITSLATAVTNLKELLPNSFSKAAKRKLFADRIDLSKSFVRLSAGYKKLGGGLRVKSIRTDDNWNTSVSGGKNAYTVQQFNYTTSARGPGGFDITVSSGVASYEPLLGGEENPFHQPVFYTEKVLLQLDKYYYIEEPFCESLFPGAGVGYSKVTVTNFGSEETESKTGRTINEFFTAGDFPTKVEVLPMETVKNGSSRIVQILFSRLTENFGAAQGYKIENNDMHGKLKSEAVYNYSGAKISSAEYFYKTLNAGSEKATVDNRVKLVSRDGSVTDGIIGYETDAYTDMRESKSLNEGHRIQASGGLAGVFFIPLPFLFPGWGDNYDKRTYRSASTVKTINRYGVLEKVRKMENGSYVTAENLLWDAETGEVLLTKTQNEYDDPLYTFKMPAYWVYPNMGTADDNEGAYIENLKPSSIFQMASMPFACYGGEELIDLSSNERYWVDAQGSILRADGSRVTGTIALAKIKRSGKRNLFAAAAATFTTMQNPISGAILNIGLFTKILQTEAVEFSDQWKVPYKTCTTCPEGYTLSEDGTYCFTETAPVTDTIVGCKTVCPGDRESSYSSLGTVLYKDCYDIDGASSVDTMLRNNPFWKGSACDSTVGTLSASDSTGSYPTGTTGSCNLDPQTAGHSSCGPLNRAGIWTCEGRSGKTRMRNAQWFSVKRSVYIPAGQIYYIGMAADNRMRFRIDGKTRIKKDLSDDPTHYQYWHIYPIYIEAGMHQIEIQGYNNGLYGSVALEIYNNSAQEIAAATGYNDLDLLFSTKDLVGQSQITQVCPEGYESVLVNGVYKCRSVISTPALVNPYLTGFAGNWRATGSYVFQTDRSYPTNTSFNGATDIRRAGAYGAYTPFWQYTAGTWSPAGKTDLRWVQKSAVTAFNDKGEEVENRDALGNYSAALFGYRQTKPVAVAQNAKFKEISFEGFEDYYFQSSCMDYCLYDHLSFGKLFNTQIKLTAVQAHSGKYALQFAETVSLTKKIYPDAGQYTKRRLSTLLEPRTSWFSGFSPQPGKKYIISLWVRDAQPRNPSTDLGIEINGNAIINSSLKWPVVEGWKRVEISFTVASNATQFNLQFLPNGTTYLDDLRIYPADADMKSFVYDDRSQRLTAELDENNFASFYEYDDQGILIRVKKETQRGIVTVKESRSSYKK